jgi:hypothetical protein
LAFSCCLYLYCYTCYTLFSAARNPPFRSKPFLLLVASLDDKFLLVIPNSSCCSKCFLLLKYLLVARNFSFHWSLSYSCILQSFSCCLTFYCCSPDSLSLHAFLVAGMFPADILVAPTNLLELMNFDRGSWLSDLHFYFQLFLVNTKTSLWHRSPEPKDLIFAITDRFSFQNLAFEHQRCLYNKRYGIMLD